MQALSIGGCENLDFDAMPFEFSRVALVLMPAWSPDQDGVSINDPESCRVILKSSIDSDIGLAFWEKLFEGVLDGLQTIHNLTIDEGGILRLSPVSLKVEPDVR
jgi:hypothetical protein